MDQPPACDRPESGQAPRRCQLSADAARRLVELAARDDASNPASAGSGSVWWASCRDLAKRQGAGAHLDEPVLRELVQTVIVAGLNIPAGASAAVADVTTAVTRSIQDDAAALQRIQSWWQRLCGEVEVA